MLETLVNFKQINRRPWLIFVWAFIITTVAILVSSHLWFHVSVSGTSVNLTGIFSVLFTIIPSAFFLTILILREEAIEEKYIRKHYHEDRFFERHTKDFLIFLGFFAGVTLAFSFWFMMLPTSTFTVQVSKINQMLGLSGAVSGMGPAADNGLGPSFHAILSNNMNVMFFAFLFSFIFGANAIFIIVWNASILGVRIGQISAQVWHIPINSMLYILHGVPEIAGYIAAAMAGGLMSVAIIRRHGSAVVSRVLVDSFYILMFAAFSVICGAFIEASSGMYFWASLALWWGVFIAMLLKFFVKI